MRIKSGFIGIDKVIEICEYDDIDRMEIKFGIWMCFHHLREPKFAFSMLKYSLGIIKRGVI